MPNSKMASHHHQLALRVLPNADLGDRSAEWAATVAAVAAWPPCEPLQPVLERRFWRAGRRGRLHQAVVAGLRDPLGLCSIADARAELRELTRPLWSSRPMPKVSAALRLQLANPTAAFVAELGRLDSRSAEALPSLLPIFAQLVSGLEALPGAAGLSLRVGPTAAGGDQESDEAPRGVEFSLRLFAGHAVAPTLRARAEALCLARPARDGDWRLAVGSTSGWAVDALRDQRPLAPAEATPSDVAALMLALPEPAGGNPRVAVGRPLAGPLPKEGAVIGRVPRPNGTQAPFRLSWDERRHHVLLAGASGSGKTTAMLRLALDDLEAGRTVVLIDPHGDVADQLAAVSPVERLLHVDPRRADGAPLDLLDPDPARAASHLMSAVTEVWPVEFSGPVWQRAISLACRCLHAAQGERSRSTLVDLERFFVNADWRETQIARVIDPALRFELERENDAWMKPARDDVPMTGYLASKLTPLTQGPCRALFEDPIRTDLETAITGGAVVVVALPLGTLGNATTRLVSRMFLTRLTAAIAAQGDRPEGARHPVSVFIDEAHLSVGQALAGLFAQGRKFNCSVTIACQNPSQLEPHLEDVLTNAQTHLYGRVSQREALHLGARIGEAGVRALPRLPRHHLLVALEDNDPDLPPLILSPVAPPMLPAPQARPERPAPSPAPELADIPQNFDELLDELFPAPRGIR